MTQTNATLFLCLILGVSSASAVAQETAEDKPRVRAARLQPGEFIHIDGRLDEAAWQRAIPAANFRQQDPDFGQPATEKTEVRFLFSRRSLYIGVICYDAEPDKLQGNTMQRDGSLAADDRFMWVFDPYLDGRSGYYFEMNPSGAMGDSLLSGSDNIVSNGAAVGGGNTFGGGDARAWDGIWFAKVNKSDVGWTIEIEIPFQTLNFDPTVRAWGANFQRSIRRKNEESLWTGYGRNQGIRRMTNAGLLEGISDVSQGVGLNVQPYFTGNYVDAPGRNLTSTFEKDAGIDFVYSVTPQLKANFTVNTDFAETEVDQRRVNLTRFPLFFPEKRQFFLEGATFFDFAREQGSNIRPFFSRQIGLDADGHPQRIDFGTKLAGQVGANNIGVLQVRTANLNTLVGEDFTVVRSKQRFFRQSYVGMMFTRRAERGAVASDRNTVGADFQLATSTFHGSENMNMSGFYLATTRMANTTGGRAAWGLRWEYPNDRWLGRMAFREVQAGYDPAVGFIDRRNFRRYNPEIVFSPRPRNSRIVRRWVFRNDDEIFTDPRNRPVTKIYEGQFGVDFQSGDTIAFHLLPTYERLENTFEISRGVILPIGGEYTFTRYSLRINTANRRVLSVSTNYTNGGFYSGHGRDLAVGLGIRPRPGVLINLNSEWNRVALAEGQFSTALLRLNANNQFSPWISIANNVQYDSVTRVLGWQSRFRWILRPGNDVYFVYAHNWLEDPIRGRITLDRSAASKVVYTHRF